MHRQPFVILSVALEMLMLATLHARIDALICCVVGKIVAFNDKEVLVMIDDHTVKIGEAAMAKGHEVNGIKQVGLPHPVASDKTIQLL